MDSVEVKVPDIGEFTDVDVIEVRSSRAIPSALTIR
jgi:hypothetical protein